MGLNHIYKVIWSKTKNAWVVVSEIAKRDGKSSVKSVVTSLAGKSVAAVMVAMVMCGGVAFAGAGTELGGGTATKSSSIAIGTSFAYEDDGIAIGTTAQAKDRVSIAIGRESLAKSERGIAVGYKTVTESGISIGDQSSSDSHGMAIGQFAKSLGSAIVFGDKSSGRDEAVVIGNSSRGDGSRSVTVGRNNSNYGDFSTLVGYNSTIGNSNARSILVGANSSITNSSYVTAVGNDINVGSGYNFAAVLGYQSATSAYTNPTDTTVSGVTLDASQYAGKGTTLGQGAILSIGDANKERQIKNVAAGVISATSTDAVNGSQLYEAVRAVTAGASPDVYMHVNDGVGTQAAGNATTNLGKANEKGGATGNRSIAIGVGSQASGQNSVVIGSEVKSASDNIVAIGNPAAGSSTIGTNSMGATLIGYNSIISNNSASSSVFGSNSSVLGTSSVAINNASVNGTNSVAINGAAGRFLGINQFTSNNAVAINGVAKGNNNIAIGGSVGYSKVGDSYLVSGSNFSTPSENSIAIGNNTLVTQKNTVMVGTYDKEYTAKANTDKNKVITPALHTAYYTLGAVDKQYYEGTLNNSVYLGHESYAFTPDALVDDESHLTGEQSIHTKKYDATGNIVVSNNTTGGAFGKVSKATINGDEITGFAGAQSVGAVTIGAGDYERRIQNVAAGEVSATSTDGINGSQLYAVANTLSKNMSSYMHINDGTSTQTVGNATTNYGYSGSKAGATGNYAIAGGVNAVASGENSIAIGRMSNATANWGVALGYQSRTSEDSSIAIGSFSEATKKHSIAIGSGADSTISGALPPGGTVVNGEFSIGLASGAQISGDSSIGIGRGVTIEGNSNIGIGKYIATLNLYGIQSENNVAIGNGSGVVGQKSVFIGYNGQFASVGNHPNIFGNESVIIGNGSTLGPFNNPPTFPTSLSDLGIGNHIIGNRSRIDFHANNSLIVGNDSSAKGDDAIAIGHGANALADKSISIGTGNEVKGAKSSAIGDPSYIDTTATGTHVQGNDNGTAINPIKASESTFMGNTNLAGTAGTTGIHVVGNNNSVDSSNVMVMGNNVTVGTGLDGAVVLGHASSADQYAAATDSTINGVTFEAAGYAGNTGLNNGSIVSVGATGTERQIKNVAAGAVTATSTDAVNGSQLYKTAETILKMPINMAGDSGDTVGLKLGKTVNIKGSVASGADVTDGNIAVVGDKATSTLSLKMAKNLTGLTSGTFTDATGNQTVINGAGVTVTPTGTGTTPISITTSGINAGNQEIKGVKKGTTDDAAVNKKQMDDALAGISSTLTINDGTTDGSVNIKTGKLKVVGESGANALVTTTVSGDTISVGTSTKLQNAVTAAEKSADKDLSNLSTTGSDKVKTLAQDAVKVAGTGLATVSDATAAGVKTYTVNVDEGKLVIDDTTGKIGATGASQGTVQGKDGVATTQNVASVVNSAIDKTKQALDDAKHNFAGDDATVISRKHGEQLNIKGGASTTATDLTSGNIAVVGDTTSGTLNIKMAKALTGLTSATYTDSAGNTQTVTGGSSTISDAAGNSTVVSKGGVTTTDAAGNTTTTAPTGVTVTPAGAGATPISVTTSGISAGNKEIKNVGKATTDDAAVNKKQMDDALKGATDNTVSLGSESGSTTAKKLSTTGGIKFNIKGETGANALITTSATGDDVTIAPTAKLTAAVTAAEKSADKDLSNLSTAGDTYIKNLAKSAASWNVETNGAGATAVAGGDTVNFIDGDNIAITNTGRSITIGTAKNVSFDKVTVGGVVIDKTDGINAGGKEIKGVATGTAADSAVNKAQMDAAITAAAGGSLSTEKVVAKTLTGDNNLATVTGQTGTAKGETYEVSVSENAVNKATTDAKHDFGGDDATVVTRKHGEKLNIKGGASTTAADLTSGNIAVLGDAATGTLNIRMAKALTGLSSATFTTPGGTTVINGGGMTITPSTTGAAPISITTGGINAGNTEIKNVAAGTTATSAVNKQQMDNAISNATANVGFNTAGNTGTGSVSNGQTLTITGTNGIETNASGQSITVGLDAATRAQINNATTTANNAAKKDLSNIDNAGKQVIKDTAAWNVKVNSGTPETVKGGDTVTFNDGDNIKVTNTGKDITIATKKDVSFDKVTVGNVVIDKNTNRISGLANAANNDEAVNLGQMNAAISTATAGTGTIKYKANGGTQNSVALTTGFDFKGDSNIQITADPANSGVINYKLNPALTGITSISGGTGAPTITLNAGSGSTPGNVSINSNLDMGGKQINNIGAATHAGDAVNKAQMDQALQNIAGASSNAAKSYAYKAGAGAAALAALKPIQYDPLEPTQIMAGIGNYKSQTAVALGVAHYTNENTMFNLGVSLDSHDGIVNAGVTHKFGYSPEKKAIPDKYKGGPISSIYVMQDEVTALQAIVQKQAAENEALRQQNEDMQRKVDMILSKIH